MLSHPRRPQSGHITCYLNRTYHVLPTLLTNLLTNPLALVDRSRYPCPALAVLPTSNTSPRLNYVVAAMSVQYSALSAIPPLHIVLYCLTPPEFRRYSSLTLCLPYPAQGEDDTEVEVRRIEVCDGGNPSGKQGEMLSSRVKKCAKMAPGRRVRQGQ